MSREEALDFHIGFTVRNAKPETILALVGKMVEMSGGSLTIDGYSRDIMNNKIMARTAENRKVLEETERIVKGCNGNRSEAGRLLGLSESAVRGRVARLYHLRRREQLAVVQ